METLNFIKENQINNYEEFKKIFESEPYNLKIKEDNNYPDLFLIYSQNTSDFTNKIVKECNGLIFTKSTLKLVCYSFDKCSDSLTIPEDINKDSLYIEHAYEGTMVKMFYYNDKWILSTKKCIDASNARWISKKSFYELFKECEYNQNINIEDNNNILNKNYCYTFIIAHPENNIVVNYNIPLLFHISTRDMESLKEIEQVIGINKPTRTIIDKNNIDNFIDTILNINNLYFEGYIFIDTNYNRWKLRTPIYNRAREIWGNTNNRMYRYMELRKDPNLLHEYLMYFPLDKNNFIDYENKIRLLASDILKNYIGKHITKTIDKVPYYYSKIIYKLHGDFYKDKIKTNLDKVSITLLDLDVKQLCYTMNNYDKSLNTNNTNIEINNLVDMEHANDNNLINNSQEINGY
jgi:hypothetical protein